jgi:phage terminase small subunit
MTRELTARQQRFVSFYVAGDTEGNAEQSAVKAGYSVRYARGNAHKIVANSGISSRACETVARAAMDADEALSRLGAIARFDLSNFLVRGERIVSNPRTAEIVRREPCLVVDVDAIKAAGFGHVIKSTKCVDGVNEVEFHDSHAALRDVGRHLKLFTDRVGTAADPDDRAAIESLNNKIAEYMARIRTVGFPELADSGGSGDA